jgi:hypothetical protein
VRSKIFDAAAQPKPVELCILVVSRDISIDDQNASATVAGARRQRRAAFRAAAKSAFVLFLRSGSRDVRYGESIDRGFITGMALRFGCSIAGYFAGFMYSFACVCW